MKPPITPSSELGVSPLPKEEDGWGKESEDEVDAKCPYSVGVFSEDHDGEEFVRCQNVQCGHTLFMRPIPNRPLYVTRVRYDRHQFIVATKGYEKLYFVILINITSCLWSP